MNTSLDRSLYAANKFFNEDRFEKALEIYKEVLVSYPDSFQDYVKLKIELCNNEILYDFNKDSRFSDVFKNNNQGWTAIITLWKRKEYLGEQLKAIMEQTIPPESIIIIKNEKHIEIKEEYVNTYPITVISSELNSLYTRWIIGYLTNTKYVNVFDDDVIPGRKWIESCIRVCETKNALVGPSGRIACPNKNPAWKSVDIDIKGERKFCCEDKDVECDWVCNSYFFKTEWIKYITSAERYLNTQKTFDDIQLATTLRHYGGIKVFVPKQPKDDLDRNGHIKRHYGHDEYALWKRSQSTHTDKRNILINKINNSDYTWVLDDE